ncbi:MAG: type I-E CRISPR-associated endoribonuclease Cas2e [bacterium]
MIFLELENAPTRLKGNLKNWLQELRAGLFVGKYNRKIRHQIWSLISKNIGSGNALLIWPENNEQGYEVRVKGVNRRQPVRKDGLILVKYDGEVKTDRDEVVTSLSPWTYRPSQQSNKAPCISVHDLIDKSLFKQRTEGRGTELGRRVHVFGELYLENYDIEPNDPGKEDKTNLKNFLDNLEGDLQPEVACSLTLQREEGKTCCLELRGLADLVEINGNQMHIIDYKTDLEMDLNDEYCKQLSAYYYALGPYHKDKKINLYLYYTFHDRLINIEPLDSKEWENLVWETYESSI